MLPLHERLAARALPRLVIAGALDEVGCARAREVADGLPTRILRSSRMLATRHIWSAPLPSLPM